MKRKDFVKSLAVLAAMPLLPAFPEEERFPILPTEVFTRPNTETPELYVIGYIDQYGNTCYRFSIESHGRLLKKREITWKDAALSKA